jgi:hypothetical protein
LENAGEDNGFGIPDSGFYHEDTKKIGVFVVEKLSELGTEICFI